jgi:hypothetical protein
MHDFAVTGGTVSIYVSLETGVRWRLQGSAHESDAVAFEHGLEKIRSTDFEHVFDFIVAGVFPETLVEQVAFIKLDGTALVAEHELLEGHEAQVPGITFLISDEFGKIVRRLNHRTNLKLPNAAIVISVTHERSPVFEMLSLVGGEGHHTNVRNQVATVDGVEHDISLVINIEDIHQLVALPDGISSQQEVLLVRAPVNVTD